MPEPLKYFIVAELTATLAHFLPYPVLTTTGLTTDTLTNLLLILVDTGVLMTVSIIGVATRKVWGTAAIFSLVLTLYFIQHYVRAGISLTGQWPTIALPFTQLALNAWVLNRLLKSTIWSERSSLGYVCRRCERIEFRIPSNVQNGRTNG